MEEIMTFNESELGKAFRREAFNFPNAVKVNSDCLKPAVLIGDDIFSLNRWLMKPYPGKISLFKSGFLTTAFQEHGEQ